MMKMWIILIKKVLNKLGELNHFWELKPKKKEKRKEIGKVSSNDRFKNFPLNFNDCFVTINGQAFSNIADS